VNNCAAAALLILKVLAGEGETIVSRGELVEIGGDFRVPDVMGSSGTRMIEVGTTNRTHLQDFQRAINPNTRLIMRVHPANYRIVGFASSPERAELAALARDSGLPLYEDAGSGQLADLRKYGVVDEPVVRDIIESGVEPDEITQLIQAVARADRSQTAAPNTPRLPHIRVGKLQVDQKTGSSPGDMSTFRRLYDESVGVAERLWESATVEGKPDADAANGMVDSLAQAVAQNRLRSPLRHYLTRTCPATATGVTARPTSAWARYDRRCDPAGRDGTVERVAVRADDLVRAERVLQTPGEFLRVRSDLGYRAAEVTHRRGNCSGVNLCRGPDRAAPRAAPRHWR
jgi:hypothetical protein